MFLIVYNMFKLTLKIWTEYLNMSRKPKIQEKVIPEIESMIQPIGKIGSRDVYKSNPFIAASKGFCLKVRKNMTLVAKGLEIKDQYGDEVNAGVIGKIEEIDTEEFVKLYTKNVGLFFDLTSRAQKALVAVFCAVQKAKDQAHIFLPYNVAIEYYEKLNITKIPGRSTFSAGITDLINMNFLAAHYHGEGWYWFNPNLIFNGDRIRFVTEYRIKVKEENFKELF